MATRGKSSAFLGITLIVLSASPAFAQKGKGGGGSKPPVYYRVTPIALNSSLILKDLSGSSEVVGYLRTPEERFPFVWTKESGFTPLQSLLSQSDQQSWHLEIPYAINDSHQIVGFASTQGGDENGVGIAFRLDLNNGAVFTVLEEGFDGSWGAEPGFQSGMQINNCGDVVLGVNGTIRHYPSSYPMFGSTDLQFRGYVKGVNCFGEIIVDARPNEIYEFVRLTPNSSGGYTPTPFPGGHALLGINDAGTIYGYHNGDNSSKQKYHFRYTDEAGDVILTDGKRTITTTVRFYDANSLINEHGDICLTGPAIHTAEGQYIDLNALIHPEDAPGYRGLYVIGIGSRNETGLPPVIVQYPLGYTDGPRAAPLYDSFLLTPVPAGN